MKKFFIDVETTGINAYKNGIIQLAGIIEIDGVIRETVNLTMQPYEKDVIEDKALEVNGITREQIDSYIPAKEGYKTFITILSKYINKFDKKDKFHFIGYNSRFDEDFIRSWFKKSGDFYFGSWFFWPAIDISNIAAIRLMSNRGSMPNFKLMTVAEACGIKIDPAKAHDALYDIEVTKELYDLLINEINGGFYDNDVS